MPATAESEAALVAGAAGIVVAVLAAGALVDPPVDVVVTADVDVVATGTEVDVVGEDDEVEGLADVEVELASRTCADAFEGSDP